MCKDIGTLTEIKTTGTQIDKMDYITSITMHKCDRFGGITLVIIKQKKGRMMC